MNRPHLLLAIFICTFTSIYSQDITFGIKGGYNIASAGEIYHYGPTGGNNVTPAQDTYYSPESITGNNYGAYFRININYFYVQPEINFSSIAGNYELAKATTEWTQSNTNIPILFGYRAFGPVAIYAGPVISMISDRQLEGTEETGYANWQYEKTNTALGAGLTASWNRISVDARYVYGFTKVQSFRIDMDRGKYGTNLGEMVEYNPSQFVLNLQVDLFSFGGARKHSKRPNSDWRNHKNLR